MDPVLLFSFLLVGVCGLFAYLNYKIFNQGLDVGYDMGKDDATKIFAAYCELLKKEGKIYIHPDGRIDRYDVLDN
jgi:hypothetical protein